MLALFALAAAAAVVAPPPAQDAPPPAIEPSPELWRGARVGMKAAQVAALFPQGRAAAPVLVTRPPVANAVTDGLAAWAVDEQVFGRPALATYYFSPTGGLLEVVVNVKDLRLRHTRDNVEQARAIRTGLIQYYGQPKVCLDTARRGLDRLDCRWVTRSVQVGLSYVDYGGLGPNLDVAVRALPPRLHERGAAFRLRGASY